MEHVIVGLRKALSESRNATAFLEELGGRVHQLIADMVDGRVLPKSDAVALKAAIMALVRAEALPKLGERNPDDAIRILDKLSAYGFTDLEDQRPHFVAARAARYPPPPPASWPEIEELHRAAKDHPHVCVMAPPVENAYFVRALQDKGTPIPEELVTLYSASDGIDIACLEERFPVFALLASDAIDNSPAEKGYPDRAVVFQGGDEYQFSFYPDRRKQWWLVLELEYAPIAKKAADIREVLRYALKRMRATSLQLEEDVTWERFFGLK